MDTFINIIVTIDIILGVFILITFLISRFFPSIQYKLYQLAKKIKRRDL